MKVTVHSSGHIPLAKSYNIDDGSAVPNLGDTVVIDGTPLEVYERVFNLNRPREVDLLCKLKSHSSGEFQSRVV